MINSTTETLADAFVRCRDMDASLSERLEAYSDAVKRAIPEYTAAVDRLVERLTGSGAGTLAPKPGEPMPAFLLPDENGQLTSLEAVIKSGPVAVTLHRGHWCPWCRISATALARAHRSISAAGGQVVAITPETRKYAAEFKRRAQSPFPFLTDLDNGYALALNLAIWVGPDIERLLSSLGHYLPDFQGNDAWFLPIPATFVVGRNGLVAARFLDPDFRRRVAVEDLIGAIEAAQDA
jgi:peroxiredoxin